MSKSTSPPMSTMEGETQPLLTSTMVPTFRDSVEMDGSRSNNMNNQDRKTKEKQKSTCPSLSLLDTIHYYWTNNIIDHSAFQFALRMAVLLTISSGFVLIRTSDWEYPDGMWVLVSVLFVSWFPALDAASVIEKITQRLIGTFVGAVLGLSCGFISIWIWNDGTTQRTYQAVFLACCVFLFNFGIIFIAGQVQVGRIKVIRRFAYATILCVLTFCICMLPFDLDDSDPKWSRGVSRVANVVVGCVVGALGSIIVCPKSTTDVLAKKAQNQVSMAGAASEAVLHMACDFFSGRIHVNRLADELLDTPLESELQWKLFPKRNNIAQIEDDENNDSFNDEEDRSLSTRVSTRFHRSASMRSTATDVALKKYEDAIADWKASKMLFPLTKYDPFFHQHGTYNVFLSMIFGSSKNRDTYHRNQEADLFHTEIARTLARTLRIQTTIVVIDGMVRSDADYVFSDDQLDNFARIGTLIRQMLTVPLNLERSNKSAKELFLRLDEIRKSIVQVTMEIYNNMNKENHNGENSDDKGGDKDEDEGVGNDDGDRYETLKDFQRFLLGTHQFLSTTRTEEDDLGRGIPKNATDCKDNSLFFLQLIEHLILRSLRLYQTWKHVEYKKKQLHL